MKGASRASLAQASDQLATLATTKAVADKVGTELFSVAALLDHQHGLRRALSDPSREAAAKTGLAHTLLDGKVSAETVELTATLEPGQAALGTYVNPSLPALAGQQLLGGVLEPVAVAVAVAFAALFAFAV